MGSFLQIAFLVLSVAAWANGKPTPKAKAPQNPAAAKTAAKPAQPKPPPRDIMECDAESSYLEQDWAKALQLSKKQLATAGSRSCGDCKCPEPLRAPAGVSVIAQGATPLPAIPAECIAKSMLGAEDLKSRFSSCSTGVPKHSTTPPCFSSNALALNHTWTNQALQCMHQPLRPLAKDDVREIFALIHHESRFQSAVDSPNGRCLMQLTSTAAIAFHQKDYDGIRKYWDAVKERPACAPFSAAAQQPLDWRKIAVKTDAGKEQASVEFLNACQFTNPAAPPAKCLVIGMSLYLAYFDLAAEQIDAAIEKGRVNASERMRMIRLLTRGYYNRGPSVSAKVWRHLLRSTAKKGGPIAAADFPRLFEKAMPAFDSTAKNFHYLTRVDRDYKLLMEKMENRSCP